MRKMELHTECRPHGMTSSKVHFLELLMLLDAESWHVLTLALWEENYLIL